MRSELNRRIGAARGDFRTLAKVWKHSNLSRDRKLKIFSSLIESRLLYGLPSGCLNVAAERRLDGFQCRCLRQILGIPSAYIGRTSNKEVFRLAGHTRASLIIHERQLILLGSVLRAPQSNPISHLSFTPGTEQPAVTRYVRRVGRPRREWVPTVLERAYGLTGCHRVLLEKCQDEQGWKHFVRNAMRQRVL